MTSTRVLLVRHGTCNAVGRSIAGRLPGEHLNAEGLAQAAHLATRLARQPIAAVYSSPLERAVETAEAIAHPHGLSVEVRPGLNELDFGEWSGRNVEELEQDPHWQRFHTHRRDTRPPGGELMSEAQDRMLAEIEEVCARHPGERVVMVGHADPIKAVLARFAGISLDEAWKRLEVACGSISELEVTEEYSRVLRVNEQA